MKYRLLQAHDCEMCGYDEDEIGIYDDLDEAKDDARSSSGTDLKWESDSGNWGWAMRADGWPWTYTIYEVEE